MRVYIKLKNHKKFRLPIPMPMFIFRLALSKYVKEKIISHCDYNSRKYLENIDFEALYRSLEDLKDCKGLRLVEVSQGDGTEVTIIV